MEGKASLGGKAAKKRARTKLTRFDQSNQPIHNQIAAALRRQILSGVYTKDSGLPPELDLADQFEVSRTTIRAALQKLVIDGLIERRRGVGTAIVSSDLLASAWVVDSLEAIIGEFKSAELIFAKAVAAKEHPEMAKLFGLGRQDAIFKVIRLLKSEAGPYAYSTIFTRVEFGARVPQALLAQATLTSLIEQYCSISAARVRQSSAATKGPVEATKALDVPLDHPMLRLRRLFLSLSGEPITHSELFCRSDRYTPTVVFAREVDTPRQKRGTE